MYRSEHFLDWLCLPREGLFLFVAETAPRGQSISPPNWQVMAFHSDFSKGSPCCALSKRDSGIHEGVFIEKKNLEVGSLNVSLSLRWAQTDVNMNYPVELDLAGLLQSFVLARVAESSSGAYVGPWNALVVWCGYFDRHGRPLPADK